MGSRSWWMPTVVALLFASLFALSVLHHDTVWAIVDAGLFAINAFAALRLRRQARPPR